VPEGISSKVRDKKVRGYERKISERIMENVARERKARNKTMLTDLNRDDRDSEPLDVVEKEAGGAR